MSASLLRAQAPVTHLLYLHGFRSSPASAKAVATGKGVRAIAAAGGPAVHWVCPQLPPSPRQAMALAQELTRGVDPSRLGVIGSSLGGFYATWLAARLGCRAALLNPAVDPARDLRRHIGHLTSWHDPDLDFAFTQEDVEALRDFELGALQAPVPEPERYLVVIARDDEVLDAKEMLQRYQGAQLRVAETGGHALRDYETQHLDAVLEFFGLRPPHRETTS